MSTCTKCDRPTRDAYLCTTCTATLKKTLTTIADFALYADDKRARTGSNWRTGTIGRTPEQPLPYDPRVTPIMQEADHALAEAVNLAITHARPAPVKVLVSSRPAARAVWLTSHLAAFAGQPNGPAVAARLDAVKDRLENLFDRPPEQIYLGRCSDDCIEPLYVDTGHTASITHCPRCKQQHDIRDRRAQLEAGVDAYLATVKEIHRLLAGTFGQDCSTGMIYGLARHGLIQARGKRVEYDKKGEPRQSATYRIGEVRDAINNLHADREKKRQLRRESKKRHTGPALASETG